MSLFVIFIQSKNFYTYWRFFKRYLAYKEAMSYNYDVIKC